MRGKKDLKQSKKTKSKTENGLTKNIRTPITTQNRMTAAWTAPLCVRPKTLAYYSQAFKCILVRLTQAFLSVNNLASGVFWSDRKISAKS